ncbi:serine/threonine-protein kinase [Gordonia humi]|uniref:non-specific serine/threonine protein kinase n=1 Tax=Gordonia humi TaxID=686429 RepID=A0A840F220_9ACTN|nr:serine/threonine-protein kinase [Gordonia humi]MBB4135439.1 serine/threonine-protein kinase [Gordonia humi]
MATPDESGSTLGPYRLVRLLGRGGMGEVYEAVDEVKDRTVALKILPAHLADDEGFRARFLRESQTVARLGDPHVVPIHDYGEIDGRLFLDMRIVRGRDLRSIIDDGPLPPGRAVAIIAQIAGALDAAHSSGLLHRDVKPDNILVDENDFAYLVDFGIAQTAGATRLTQTGTAIGSFAYMAPERFGDADLTPASDVYSLACVLYETITGSPPFAVTSIEQIISGHLSRPVPPTGTVLDPVIAAGSMKDRAARIPSCGAFADAARGALAGQYAPTLVAPSAQYVPLPPESHRGKIALIAALAAVVVAAVATGTWFAVRGTDQGAPTTAADTSTLLEPSADPPPPLTTTVTGTPAPTVTRPTITETTTPTRGAGDLGLSTPITSPPCDGRTVTFVYNAVDPGTYVQEVATALARHPGSSYLRTDRSCSSLRQHLNGNPVYAVYLAGSSLAETCRIKAEVGGDAYARRLDDVTAVGVDVC